MKSDLKKQLLGESEKDRMEASKVPLEADIEALLLPMENPTSVMKVVCSGCGAVYEVDEGGVAELAAISKVKLPIDTTKKWFFKVNGCLVCNGPGDNITLEEIHVS